MRVILFIILYLIIANALGFLLSRLDRRHRDNGSFRFSPVCFVILGSIGAVPGIILGVHEKRIPIRRPLFRIVLPAILAVQAVFVIFLLLSPYFLPVSYALM